MLRWHVDFFVRQMSSIEVFQKICMVAAMEVDIGMR